jgi:hypothetical protein
LAAFSAACGGGVNALPDGNLAPKEGYMVLEPVEYELSHDGAMRRMVTDEARIWYSFRPAATEPAKKPLALFFNGGPGCATAILLGFNTKRLSLDRDHNGGTTVGASPSDWGSIANLLYIDARNTGFSYGIGDAASAFSGPRNFNPYIDAGDFLRVLLRFLSIHREIRANPVIIVGESYGGARSSLMLDILLHYRRFAGGDSVYNDRALSDEIQRHFDAVLPEKAGMETPPEDVALQFGRNVMISPYMLGGKQDRIAGEMLEQPGGPPYIVAQETGGTFVPCREQQDASCNPRDNALNFINGRGRDVYIYKERRDWVGDRGRWVTAALLSLADHSAFMEGDPKLVTLLYASERSGAYKLKGGAAPQAAAPRDWLVKTLYRAASSATDPDAEFKRVFGELRPFDRYYEGCNNDVLGAFENDQPHSKGSDNIGRMWLESLLHVKTFITAPAWDTVIWAPSIPEATRLHGEVASVDMAGERMTVTFRDGAFEGLKAGESRTVAFVKYAESGHPVTMSEPVKLLNDVKTWLGE